MFESELLFQTGIVLIGAAGGLFVISSVVLFITGRRLRAKLEKEFGERIR